MNAEPRERSSLFAGLLSAKVWVVLALGILAAFALFHALGWRDDTRFISGAAPLGFTMVRGLIYALAYFGAVILAPILLLAALLLSVLRGITKQK